MDFTNIFLWEPYFQLLLAMSLGSILGFERYFVGKTAGMRTYGLVSMGACIFTLITLFAGSALPSESFSPMHVIAGIITGIGFLGAGLIIFKDSKLTGLTTAAGLWVAAAIGIAVGYKFYGIAIFATVLVLINFTFLWNAERKLKELVDEEEVPTLK